MFDIMNSIISTHIDFATYCICSLVAILCGAIVAVAAGYRSNVSKSFTVSLILLPLIVETVIIMVNGNIGTGVAVMGAFSLVRFRSVPGKAKDIAAIFTVMTVGLTCAAGYIWVALIFTVVVSLVTVILASVPLKEDRTIDLRITVPESLSFSDAFDDIFAEYTRSYKLVSVKTSNMGSLYKLLYRAELKDRENLREMIDKLRCKNGNLEISATNRVEEIDEL